MISLRRQELLYRIQITINEQYVFIEVLWLKCVICELCCQLERCCDLCKSFMLMNHAEIIII